MLPQLLIVFACLISTSGGSDVVLGILGKSAFIECQLPISNTLVWQTEDGNVIAINGKVTNENSTKYLIEKQNGFRESLVIRVLTLADDNIFRCFDLKNSSFVDTTKLNVLAPPLVINATSSPPQPMLEGTEVTFTCEADGGKPLPGIKWFIKSANGSITEVYGNTIDIKYTNGTGNRRYTLTTNVTRDMYQSTFICNVTVPLLYQEMLTVDADVLLAPIQPTIASPDYDGSFDENSVLNLECTSEGSRPTPTIYWLLNGNRIGDVEVEVKPQNETFTVKSNLSKLMSRDYNGSVLTCAVTNRVLQDQGLPPRMANITLLASYKPSMTLEQNEYITKLGDNATLRCLIDANPLPKFEHLYWTHKGAMIDRKYYTLSNGSDVFSLTLEDVQMSDAGNYSCHAINRLGASASEEIKLTVLYAPVCEFRSVQKLAVRRGENARLNCNMHASPNDVIFTWRYKQTDERIKRMQGTVDINNHDRVYSKLELMMGTQLRYAEIECYGDNTQGISTSPCKYSIVPPGPPETPSNCTTLVDNSQVQMSCQAGFDGGSAQHFILQKLGRVEFETLLVRDTPDFVFNTYENATIRMCTFNDDYKAMRICAIPTKVTVNVPGQPQSDPVKGENSHKTAYIAGGVIASLGVITIAVIIALLLFRRYHKEKSRRNINNLESGSENQAIKSIKFGKWWKSMSLKRLTRPFRKTDPDQPVTADVRDREVVTDIDDNNIPYQNVGRLASTPYHPFKAYRIDRQANCTVFNVSSGQAFSEDKQKVPDVVNESTGFTLSPIVARNFHEKHSFQRESPIKMFDEVMETNSVNDFFNETTEFGISNCYNTEDMLDVLCDSDGRDFSRCVDTETLGDVRVKTLHKEYTDGDIDDVLDSYEDEGNTEQQDKSNVNGSTDGEENSKVLSVNELTNFGDSVTVLKFMNVDFSAVSVEDETASKVNNLNEESFAGNNTKFFDKSFLLCTPVTKSSINNTGKANFGLAKAYSLPYRLGNQRTRSLNRVSSLSNLKDNQYLISCGQNQMTNEGIKLLNHSINSFSSDKKSSDAATDTAVLDMGQTTTDNTAVSSKTAETSDILCDIDKFTLTIASEASIEYGSKEEIDITFGDTSENDGLSTMNTDYSDMPLDIDAFTLTITSESGANIVEDTNKDENHLTEANKETFENELYPESALNCDKKMYSPRRDLLRRESFLEAINNAAIDNNAKTTRYEDGQINVKIDSETESSYFNYGYEKDGDGKSNSDSDGEDATNKESPNEENDCVNVVAYF